MAVDGQHMIAPCGLDCSVCDIYRAQSEPEILKQLVDWFINVRKVDPKDLKPEQITCAGCLGDRAVHWSPTCGFLKCSVDERGLTSCAECGDFPCENLTAHAAKNARYTAALERLKGIRAQAK